MFGDDHLRFLSVDGKWWPSLIFESYTAFQYAVEKIEEFGKLRSDVLCQFLERHGKGQSVDGKIAILLGTEKKVIWCETNQDAIHFYKHLQAVLILNFGPDHYEAVKEAQMFLDLDSVPVEAMQLEPPPNGPRQGDAPQDEAPVAESEVAPANKAHYTEQPLCTQEQPDSASVPETPPPEGSQEHLDDSSTINESIGSGWDHEDSDTAARSRAAPATVSETKKTKKAAPKSKGAAKKEAKKKHAPVRKATRSTKAQIQAQSKAKFKDQSKAKALSKFKARAKNQSKAHSKSAHKEARCSPRREDEKKRKSVKFEIQEPSPVVKVAKASRALTKAETTKEYKIPDSKVVFALLQKLGYRSRKYYYRPPNKKRSKDEEIEGEHFFKSLEGLRRYLCRHGVESGGFELSKDDEETIDKWVRYAICPSLRNKRVVPEGARSAYKSIHSPLLKLGFQYLRGVFHFPGVTPRFGGGIPLNGFQLNKSSGLWDRLCRFGLPDSCKFKELSETERLRVELYLTECPDVDTFSFETEVDAAPFEEAASFAASASKEAGDETCKPGLAVVPAEKPDSLHSLHTPIVANKAVGATSQPNTDQGSIAAESVAPTVVTNCSSATSIEEQVEKEETCIQDEAGIATFESHAPMDETEDNFVPLTQAETESKLRSSPLQRDEGSIADAHFLPKPSSSPQGPVPTKTLFPNTPAHVTEERKRSDATDREVEPLVQLPLEGSSTTKEPQNHCGDDSVSNKVDSDLISAAELRPNERAVMTVESDKLNDRVSQANSTMLANYVSEKTATPSKMLKPANQSPKPSPINPTFLEDSLLDEFPGKGSPHVLLVLGLSDNEDTDLPMTQAPCDEQTSGEHDTIATHLDAAEHTKVSSVKKMSVQSEGDSGMENTATDEVIADPPPEAAVSSLDNKPSVDMSSAPENEAIDPSLEAATVSSENELGVDVSSVLKVKAKYVIDEKKYEEWIDNLKRVVNPDALWVEVELKLRVYGLTWCKGGALTDYWYCFPGRKGERGKLGYDYLDSTYDLKKFAVETFNWKGDDNFKAEKAARESRGRRSKGVQLNSTCTAQVQKRKAESPVSTAEPIAKQPRKDRSRLLTAPEKKRTVGEKLDSCVRALQGSRKRRQISIVEDDNSSKCKAQVRCIQNFLKEAIELNNRNGRDASNQRILYVCGSPGVGKTSTVEWCCNQGERLIWCNISGASGDAKTILSAAGERFGIEAKNITVSSLSNFIKKSQKVVVLVIDEIDNLVSSTTAGIMSATRSHSEKLVQDLCSLAADPAVPFALIGISNAVDTAEARRLKVVGMNGKRLTFAPYNQTDLVQLVVARIGNTIVDEKALNFMAKRVASGSGDARQMLELVSKAVANRKGALTDSNLSEASLDIKPIVTIRNAIQAIKANAPEKYTTQIESLPEMAKLVLCVAVTLCKHVPENLNMGRLKTMCSRAAHDEFGDSGIIDVDTFVTLIQNLVDQGLLMPNHDGDSTTNNSQGYGTMLGRKVHFGSQLLDVESAIIDTLNEKPIYNRLIDFARANPASG